MTALDDTEKKHSKILSWIDLSQADVERLYTADGPACLALLRAKVGTIPTLVTDVASDPKINEVRLAVVSDMFFYAVQLAKKYKFTPEKCSVLFTMLRLTHEQATSSPHSTMQHTFDFFRQMLERHNIQRPPFSEAVFTLGDTSIVLDFALTTYFRHFKLYQYTFTKQPLLDIKFEFSDIIAAEKAAAEAAAAAAEAEAAAKAAAAAEAGDAEEGAGADGGVGEEESPEVTAEKERLHAHIRALIDAKKVEVLGETAAPAEVTVES